jgi:diacylglycerol kinase
MARKSLFMAFLYAWDGVVYSVKTQRSMKIHIVAALLAASLAWYYKISATETILLVLTIGGMIAAEMINTAIEAIVDMVSPDFHPLAKAAKDAAAGAVLTLAVASLIIGYILFFHRVFG